MTVDKGEGQWHAHYESLEDSFELFELEAEDYVRRLGRSVPLTSNQSVVDFGCGFGYAAERVAARVGKLYVWDQAQNMRERCVRRVSQHWPVEVIDLGDPQSAPGIRVDLILVNSVVQYMSLEELRQRLRQWRRLLTDDGVVVLSDVIQPRSVFVSEMLDSIAFLARNGLLLRTLAHSVRALGRYTQIRRQAPLLRLDAQELERECAQAGLAAQFLPQNLTYRSNRLSVLLRPVAAVS